MLLHIKAVFNYHSNLWPHAKIGDTKWVTPEIMEQLDKDLPGGFTVFEVMENKEEVLNGRQEKQETSGVQESPGSDSEEAGSVKETSRSNPRKSNKKSVAISKNEEPAIEESKREVEDAVQVGETKTLDVEE